MARLKNDVMLSAIEGHQLVDYWSDFANPDPLQ
jgi:hypothetical protein